jgi:hypothetical protein
MKFVSLTVLAAVFAAAPSASAFMAPKTTTSNSNSVLFSTMGDGSGLATGVGTPKVNTPSSPGGEMALTKDVWDTLSPIKVQGGSLRTWSFTTPAIDSVQVHLKTEGRPLNANGKHFTLYILDMMTMYVVVVFVVIQEECHHQR